MTFLPKALRFTRDAMAAYILAVPTSGFKPNPNTGVVWAPKGVVWHNTAIPDLKIWASYSEAQKEAWGDNYDLFCKTTQHWHSGPHAVATPEPWSAILCDLQADGVHDSCRNSDYFGVETVGNFEVGGDDPLAGAGLASMQSAANIIAALCVRFDFDPHKAIDFHRNCARDAHHCPGSLVTDAWAIGLVVARIAEIKGLKMTDTAPLPNDLPPAATPQAYTIELTPWPALADDPQFFAAGALIFNKLKALGASNPVALGLLAQAEAESSLSIHALGDNKSAYGLFQMHADRCSALKAATGIDICAFPPIVDQVTAAWYELTRGAEQAAFAKFKDAPTALLAGQIACTEWERAGAAQQPEKRGAMAERWAGLFTQHPELLAQNPATKVAAG